VSRIGSHLKFTWRQVQRLFHFVIGLAFLGLAGACVMVSLEEWKHYLETPSAGLGWFSALAAFALLLLLLALYSFLKARSVR
jgi:ABC-type uncharacterized transport system permease subunit